jgi:hypothetical protein
VGVLHGLPYSTLKPNTEGAARDGRPATRAIKLGELTGTALSGIGELTNSLVLLNR